MVQYEFLSPEGEGLGELLVPPQGCFIGPVFIDPTKEMPKEVALKNGVKAVLKS